MARAIDRNELLRLGAAARLTALREEIASIEEAFPELRGGQRGRRRASAQAGAAAANDQAPRRRSRGWNEAQRKAAAERMKAYWAKRKAGRKK